MSVTNKIVAQSAADGALPELYAATAPGVMGGDYFGPSRLFESRGAPKLVQPTAAAKDPVSAARLWAESVRLTGVTYAELDRM